MPLEAVVVEGINECIDNVTKFLKLLPEKGMKKAAGEALIIIGNEILVKAPQRTGEMKANLQGDVKTYSNFFGGTYAVEGWVGFTGLMAARAMWLEYGHRIVAFGKEVGFAKPKPFMRPALTSAAPFAFEAFASSLMESIAAGGRDIGLGNLKLGATMDFPDAPYLPPAPGDTV
jgi:hypothetical protein